jgi:small subunit ribosomal protein S1
VVRGRITKLVNFGAFARLVDTGIEGLIHISELSERRVTHPKEVVSEGDVYDLRIIRIEGDKRRLGLSLKQAMPASPEVDWQIAPSENGYVDAAEAAAEALHEAVAEVVVEVVAEVA